MITIEEGLAILLKSDAGLNALISGRVYHMRIARDSAMPCLTFQRISTPREITHDTRGASGLAHPRFQFDAWARTYKDAKAVIDRLRACLNGFSGVVGTPPNTVRVQAATILDEHPEADNECGLWRSMSDYEIWHEE